MAGRNESRESDELVDLSMPVRSGMPVYPGDPEVEIVPALTVADAGVNVLRVHLGSQTGTHVDAPFHIDDSLPALDELPLDRFIGPAVVIDVRDLGARAAIGVERLPARLLAGSIVLFAGGERADPTAHPYLTPEAAEAIIAAGVRTVGIDALSVDRTPPPGDTTFSLAAHRVLCGATAVIVENLRNLDRLLAAQAAGRSIEVVLFPLHLVDADGAPARAVARLRT